MIMAPSLGRHTKPVIPITDILTPIHIHLIRTILLMATVIPGIRRGTGRISDFIRIMDIPITLIIMGITMVIMETMDTMVMETTTMAIHTGFRLPVPGTELVSVGMGNLGRRLGIM